MTSVVLATDYDRSEPDNTKKSQEDAAFDTQLDEVVVTATHTPKALKDVPVVTRMCRISSLKNCQDLNLVLP